MKPAALILVLALATAAGATEIVWRAHCPFEGKPGLQPTEWATDSARECRDDSVTLGVWLEEKCERGNREACRR